MTKATKDRLVHIAIYGSGFAMAAAASLLFSSIGRPLPPGYTGPHRRRYCDRAWRIYQETGDVWEALSAM